MKTRTGEAVPIMNQYDTRRPTGSEMVPCLLDIYVTHIALGTDGNHIHICSLALLILLVNLLFLLQIWHNTKTKTACSFLLLLRNLNYAHAHIYIYIYSVYIKSII